jgi:hypothetical protein
MVNSIDGENSVATGEKKEELVPPVFAADLAPNVRASFDNTCVYIKDYTDALGERLNRKLEAITSRLDALTDNLINPLAREETHHAAPLRDVPPQRDGHVDVLARRPFHRYMEVLLLILRMMLVMHHDNLTLMLVVQLLFVLFLLIEVVLVMLLVYHWMMVLGMLKF